MERLRRLFVTITIVTCFLLQTQGADEYTDQKRPYEFGFTINGQQHRHEKKDKNGIIMGEFGFITADDVYHVTVYATDENGHFKIISMKNIHLKSQTGISARQGHSLQLPAPAPAPSSTSQAPPVIQTSTQGPEQPFETISLEPPVNSCSHCSIPTTSTPAPVPKILPSNQPSLSDRSYNNPSQFSASGPVNPQYPQQGIGSNYPAQQNFNNVQYSQNPSAPLYPGQQINQNHQQNAGSEQTYLAGQANPQTPGSPQGYPQQSASGGQIYPQGPRASQNYPQREGSSYPQDTTSLNNPQGGTDDLQNYAGQPQTNPGGQQNSYNGPQYFGQAPGSIPSVPSGQNYPQQNGQPSSDSYPQIASQNQPKGTDGTQYYQQGAQPQNGGSAGSRTPKFYSGSPNQPLGAPGAGQQYNPQNGVANGSEAAQGGQQVTQKPTLAYAQMQIVNKNTDINAKRPGEKEGLPDGLTKDDMVNLLYTFNYTLGFQGHFEEGYTNGAKQGYYFVTGRNGVRTRVDYVADDKGFRPKITQEVLDLLSDDVPKPETERDAKYGLKGYEFKWLYYPVESNTR